MKVRIEKDSLGLIKVPADKLWGAQTQRALLHFSINDELMPQELIKALAICKKSAAITNYELKLLNKKQRDLIIKAADNIISGKFCDHFPLRVWQSGSGTQTNMNMNEVIAHLTKNSVHPNDHVNLSQSSNDIFSTAMHVAAAQAITERLLPSLSTLIDSLQKKQQQFKNVIKIGRTHLQDAVPITLGQEFSGFVAQLNDNINRIKTALNGLYKIPAGGTAIGTGVNAPAIFAKSFVEKLTQITKLPFKPAKNKFALIAAHDDLVFCSGTLKTLAASLFKIANDIRWLGSGPRCGIGELILPANEPGSSIMPGKINPTQCEAMMMVCAQVMGNDTTITFAGSQGNFELNTFKPVIIYNLLQSVNLLSDASCLFAKYLVDGLKINKEKINDCVQNSLMLVTALCPHVGYDKAAKVAQFAHEHKLSLRTACLKLKILTANEFDKLVDIKQMV
jgi:fumarate hydratase class II